MKSIVSVITGTITFNKFNSTRIVTSTNPCVGINRLLYSKRLGIWISAQIKLDNKATLVIRRGSLQGLSIYIQIQVF